MHKYTLLNGRGLIALGSAVRAQATKGCQANDVEYTTNMPSSAPLQHSQVSTSSQRRAKGHNDCSLDGAVTMVRPSVRVPYERCWSCTSNPSPASPLCEPSQGLGNALRLVLPYSAMHITCCVPLLWRMIRQSHYCSCASTAQLPSKPSHDMPSVGRNAQENREPNLLILS